MLSHAHQYRKRHDLYLSCPCLEAASFYSRKPEYSVEGFRRRRRRRRVPIQFRILIFLSNLRLVLKNESDSAHGKSYEIRYRQRDYVTRPKLPSVLLNLYVWRVQRRRLRLL